MKLKFPALTLTTLLLVNFLFSQAVNKTIPAKKISDKLKIDGTLNEADWKDAPAALGYSEITPVAFRKEDIADRTELYMLYSDDGIYVGGYCHERTKDSISYEINGRDGFINNDFIGFVFDTYKNHNNAFEYVVTPMNDQIDAQVSLDPSGVEQEDFAWNAVWQSAAVIRNDGWTFEVYIPFSAIRFSKAKLQDWGFNIFRVRRKLGQQVVWNPNDPNINGSLTQEGYWTGLKDIDPPLRLQLSPYFSFYVNHYPFNQSGINNWSSSFNGGMDIKYGISQALTLDMTLIPDFGQVQSDNKVLNLTPFEVKFNENRSFFTEGSDLFNKGNLFYSRRIGGTPLHYFDLPNLIDTNEHIVENPAETKLINATKISGRLKKGLGIGFFNAVTNTQYAIVEDNRNDQRKIQTSPLTNYNIIVLDQSLKNNSSISFVNTNVWRNGKDYDADVAAALFNFYDKKNIWNLGGKLSGSSLSAYLPGNKSQNGYSHSLYTGKVSGKFSFKVQEDLSDDKYSSNDLGYFTNNNYLNHTATLGYHWIKPTNWYNILILNLTALYSQRFKPSAYQYASFTFNPAIVLKNLWRPGFIIQHGLSQNDFYEPRIPGHIFKRGAYWLFDGSVQTNSAKKYRAYLELLYATRGYFNGKRYQYILSQAFRVNYKLAVSYRTTTEFQKNSIGFAAINGSDIIFGYRSLNTVENLFNVKYSFNTRVIFTITARHYWSKVENKEYLTLLQNGRLEKNTTFTGNADQNYNVFTVDALCTWQFAPGSFINISWKNNATTFNGITEGGYFKNFNNTIDSPQNNNLSVKLIYFLDYLKLLANRKKDSTL